MNLHHESVWANCLSFIEDNVSAQAFKTWFIPIKSVKLEESVLTIQVPSQFFYEWLEEHYVDLLRKAIGKELGKEARLEYSIIMEQPAAGTSPYTVKLPTSHNAAIRNRSVQMPMDSAEAPIKNPFVIPGSRSSTSIPTSTRSTASRTSLRGKAIAWRAALDSLWRRSREERPSTRC